MYEPPEILNTIFRFGKAGYTPPDFNDVVFKMGDVGGVSDLRLAIEGRAFERDYLKSCDTYVLGNSAAGLQILRTNCVYGGIRDLEIGIQSIHNFLDIYGYIKAGYTDTSDVNFILKSWQTTNQDITLAIKPWYREAMRNLNFRIKHGYSDDIDLPFDLKVFQHTQDNLRNIVQGWSVNNQVDLVNVMKMWAKDDKNLLGYTNTNVSGNKDLGLEVFKIWQHNNKNIPALLHGWATIDLNKIIQAVNFFNLPAFLRAIYIDNLSAYLFAVQPVDIQAALMGWDIKDLVASIKQVPHDGDLPFSVYTIGPKDLPTVIFGRKGVQVPFDLRAYMTNLGERDLNLYLKAIYYRDLNFVLNSSRMTKDLGFSIYPKLVYIRQNISISFLESRDLAAMINYSCGGTGYANLFATILGKHKKDLRSYIYGMDPANVVDLRCIVNSFDYFAHDSIPVKMIADTQPITKIDVNMSNQSRYIAMDTISIYSANVKKDFTDLLAVVQGDYITRDLNITIRAYSNAHYSSSTVLKDFITLKLKDNKEDFRRYVEVALSSYANTYYYFSGNQRAYREFKNDHFIVRVEGHRRLPKGRGFEKDKVRRKYIFNLKNYASIDAALRDMIDRVTELRKADLPATIMPKLPYYNDLAAQIASFGFKYKSNRNISSAIKGTWVAQPANLTSVLNTIDFQDRIIELSKPTPADDFPVFIELGTSEFAYLPSNLSESAIYFLETDSNTQLPFWIEKWENNVSAKIWINVAKRDTETILLATDGDTVVHNTSDGKATFDFFEDFSSGTIDPAIWDVGSWAAQFRFDQPDKLSVYASTSYTKLTTTSEYSFNSYDGIAISVGLSNITTSLQGDHVQMCIMLPNQSDGANWYAEGSYDVETWLNGSKTFRNGNGHGMYGEEDTVFTVAYNDNGLTIKLDRETDPYTLTYEGNLSNSYRPITFFNCYGSGHHMYDIDFISVRKHYGSEIIGALKLD